MQLLTLSRRAGARFAAVSLAMSLGGALVPAYAATAAPAISAAETSFRANVGMEHYQRVEYRDINGAPIDFKTFEEQRARYPHFNMLKSNVGGVKSAVVSLLEKEPKPQVQKLKVKLGEQFPAFKLAASDGTVIDNAALRGRYTLVNFYFSECGPCVKEVPVLNAFARSHKNIATLAVTFDTMADVKKFAKQYKFGWRTVGDAGSLLEALGVNSFPDFALIDPKGKLVAVGDTGGLGEEGKLDKWVAKWSAAPAL